MTNWLVYHWRRWLVIHWPDRSPYVTIARNHRRYEAPYV